MFFRFAGFQFDTEDGDRVISNFLDAIVDTSPRKISILRKTIFFEAVQNHFK